MLKKIIFSLTLAALAAFIFTCKGFSPQEAPRTEKDELVWSDVVYSPDGSGVTIYLDGSGEYVRSSRALNLPLAKLGHDFFEVVFYYPISGSEQIIARTFWESGQKAGVTGIHRTPAGVDYGNISLNPPSGQGSAVLFVGRKEDKTLLAVGRLSQVDSNASSTLITSSTRSVTFTVDALKSGTAGLTLGSVADSSFLTAAGSASAPYTTVSTGNTLVSKVNLAGRSFPIFALAETTTASRLIRADYTFGLTSGADLNDYWIVRANAGTTVEKIIAQYTLPNGEVFPKNPPYPFDENTTVVLNNNYGGSAPFRFEKRVEFNINMNNTQANTVFGLAFSIAVHALTPLEDAVRWFIRPGYGTYLYDLDDGAGGTGGAVLIGTGAFIQDDNDGFVIAESPNQTHYNSTNGWIVNLTGLRLAMMNNNILQYTIDVDDTSVRYSLDEITWYEYADFHSVISLQPLAKGYHSIFVRYIDSSSITWLTSFQVYVGDLLVDFNPSNIDAAHRRFAANQTDITNFYNMVNGTSGSQTFLLVLANSLNIPDVMVNGGPHTIIILAGNENIILGRAGTNSIGHAVGAAAGTIYYFGEWPFSDPIHVGGNVVLSKPFAINAGGEWDASMGLPGNSQFAGGPSIATNPPFTSAAAPRMFLNVLAANLDIHIENIYSRDFLHP